jgi:hypothetical protein
VRNSIAGLVESLSNRTRTRRPGSSERRAGESLFADDQVRTSLVTLAAVQTFQQSFWKPNTNTRTIAEKSNSIPNGERRIQALYG